MNLVVNAAEAIPNNADGRIRVETRSCDVGPEVASAHAQVYGTKPGRYVCLEVQDNGTGMDEATKSKIFDPFFTTKFTGRGLGLSGIQGILRGYKGFVEVQSTPGAGTTFSVFLPASAKEHVAGVGQAGAGQKVQTVGTVLVVDDEAVVRKLLSATLKNYGYEVLEAANGREALETLAQSKVLPSLVLLDLMMPVMGGDELLPILEAQYPDLKVILSSGYSAEDAVNKVRSRSIASFLQKPYAARALVEAISQALQ
jgi:CheY-like chemotaxis protein